MAAWRYKISLLVLKKYSTCSLHSLVKYFSTLEEKFRISALPCACNILYFLNWEIRSNLKFTVLHLEKETHVHGQTNQSPGTPSFEQELLLVLKIWGHLMENCQNQCLKRIILLISLKHKFQKRTKQSHYYSPISIIQSLASYNGFTYRRISNNVFWDVGLALFEGQNSGI